jgi:hypothetical protein
MHTCKLSYHAICVCAFYVFTYVEYNFTVTDYTVTELIVTWQFLHVTVFQLHVVTAALDLLGSLVLQQLQWQLLMMPSCTVEYNMRRATSQYLRQLKV